MKGDDVRFRELSPLLAVPDVERSTAYYRDRMGFEVLLIGHSATLPAYGIVQRDGFRVHLVEDPHRDPSQVQDGFVVTVGDIDALYAELQRRGAFVSGFPRHLDAIREHPPEDKSYGRRDVIFVDPDGYILVLGQNI